MRSRALNLAALALLTGLCGSIGVATQPATAQQLDANKPPAQIFAGTCAACHRSPRGLVKSVSPGSLPGFLRQHYTTGNDMAGTMASFVLGNGGTQQVAEPPAKQEPKQREPRAKSDGQDVAARTPATDPAAHAKAAKQQKAGKKGQAPVPAEPEKPEVAKPEVAKPETPPAPEPAKPETAASDCKVEPAKQADDGAPPKQPSALLTLPGFPAPEPEPEAEAAAQPGCEPGAPVTTAAHGNAPATEPAKEQPKASAPPSAAEEAPKSEPLRATVAEPPLRASVAEPPARATVAETPSLDIMREEVHAPRVVRTGQKKRAAPPQ